MFITRKSWLLIFIVVICIIIIFKIWNKNHKRSGPNNADPNNADPNNTDPNNTDPSKPSSFSRFSIPESSSELLTKLTNPLQIQANMFRSVDESSNNLSDASMKDIYEMILDIIPENIREKVFPCAVSSIGNTNMMRNTCYNILDSWININSACSRVLYGIDADITAPMPSSDFLSTYDCAVISRLLSDPGIEKLRMLIPMCFIVIIGLEKNYTKAGEILIYQPGMLASFTYACPELVDFINSIRNKVKSFLQNRPSSSLRGWGPYYLSSPDAKVGDTEFYTNLSDSIQIFMKIASLTNFRVQVYECNSNSTPSLIEKVNQLITPTNLELLERTGSIY